jgi:hypothetical protein
VVAVRVYVEGGGDTVAQMKLLRIAVKTWLEAAIPGCGPKVTVVACGGRNQAYAEFCQAVATHEDALCILLVDSEELVTASSRWEHVKRRTGDGWEAPPGTSDENLHFMAQTMEAWFCADPDALEIYFGAGFKRAKLPARRDLEEVPRADLNDKLEASSRDSRKGAYKKGRDLGLLGTVQPARVIGRCRHAGIFVEAVGRRL